MNRLPSRSVFADLSVGDKLAVVDLFKREIEDEIAGIRSGHVFTTNGLTVPRALANARRRMRRLEGLAREFGYWEAA